MKFVHWWETLTFVADKIQIVDVQQADFSPLLLSELLI